MKAATYYSSDDIRVEELDRPVPGPGEILVRTRACGICTGDLMPWYMERKAPLVFGHEPAGEVAGLGEGVEGFREGDRVFAHHHAPCGRCRLCLRGEYVHCNTWRSSGLRPGGMAEYFVVSAPAVRADTVTLPSAMDFESASLIEPTACVVKSLRRAAVEDGDTVVVVGAGIMGMIHLVLARLAGARVIVADRVAFRLRKARDLGAFAVVDVDRCSLREGVAEATGGEMADVVIVGPGSIDAMESGIEAAGSAATVVFFTCSRPGERLSINPGELYFDEISLVPSYSSGPEDTRCALEHLAAGDLPVSDLITHRFALDRVSEAVTTAGLLDQALKTVVLFE